MSAEEVLNRHRHAAFVTFVEKRRKELGLTGAAVVREYYGPEATTSGAALRRVMNGVTRGQANTLAKLEPILKLKPGTLEPLYHQAPAEVATLAPSITGNPRAAFAAKHYGDLELQTNSFDMRMMPDGSITLTCRIVGLRAQAALEIGQAIVTAMPTVPATQTETE